MFHEVDEGLSRLVEIDGSSFLFFSGTSYLGLANNDVFNESLQKNIIQYGSSFGVSRNGNLKNSIYKKAEQQLALIAGAEAALTFSSGMLTGQAVVQYLKTFKPHFLYAPQAHPANWHEPIVTIPSCSFLEWTNNLEFPADDQPVVLVFNSIDALRMTSSDLSFIKKLPATKNITLLIDDSHGFGLLNQGRGVFSLISTPHQVIVVSSLHKAFGIAGGVVFGRADLIDALSRSVFFSGCSPIIPAFMGTFLDCLDIYPLLLTKLKLNVEAFKNGVKDLSIFQYHEEHCVFYTEHAALYDFLFKQHLFIYNFAYPDPAGRANTRIVLSAWHTNDDILLLTKGVNDFIDTLN